MKQIIVLCSMILLGLFINNLISGEQEDSILSNIKTIWQSEVDMQKVYP
ncbi:MAG: hypothetical protein WCF96_01495 [Eubacteriales bacterium]